jgi:hypothetical protein
VTSCESRAVEACTLEGDAGIVLLKLAWQSAQCDVLVTPRWPQ